MNDFSLVPVEQLSPWSAELRTRIAQQLPDIALDQGALGNMLAWSLLFGHWPELLAPLALSPESAFYNRYFWFKRFATHKQNWDGVDAGLEQSLLQLLNEPDFELDWALVEQLDHKASDLSA